MHGTRSRTGGSLLAALLATVVCALAGCGGDDTADPKPSFSPTPTASSSSPPPVAASSSAAPIQEAPEAFVRRWNDLSTQMQNTGQTSDFRVASQTCKACLATADLVDEYYAAGGFVRTKGWQLQSIRCKAPNATQATCIAKIVNTITHYRKSASAPAMSFPGGPFAEYFEMQRSSGSWNMTYIAQQAQ